MRPQQVTGIRPSRGKADPRSAGSRQRGVLLINLGTPEGPDPASVRAYLAEFLSDPEVIHLPAPLRCFNRPLGHLIARFRAPKSAAMYQRIWSKCGSPLRSITEEQASKLATMLPDHWKVFYAMRYGRPSIGETLEEIEAAGIEELIVIPMYPQYSGSTTGTALHELYGRLRRSHYLIHVIACTTWYDDGGYVYAQAKLLAEYARRHRLTPEDTYLVFSAHGLPVSYVERGDPYPAHLRRTISLVTNRLGWPNGRASLAYQSRLGPVEWLKPHTGEFLRTLADRGERRVLVCPISFTVDCLETLEEVDVRFRGEFEENGRELFLCPALNSFEPFVKALRNLVLEGPRPVTSWGQNVRPLLADAREPVAVEPDTDALVMIGVSVENRAGGCCPLKLEHTTESELNRVKKPQSDIPDLLRKVREEGDVREVLLWNTCHRFELYGWSGRGEEAAARQCIVARARDHLFNGGHPEGLSVNLLFGAEVWQHLMRTAAGLNSRLPGDRDVVDQLRAASRLAERANTAGPLARRLVREVIALERDLRAETPWGKFDPGYCFAALSRIVESSGLDLADARVVVVGGSTTSRSALAALTQRFQVPDRQLTLVYRGHSGGHMKLIRKAIGQGRRLRVQDYSEDAAIRAILDADVAIFGIDRSEPVLDAARVLPRRDSIARPFTIIDFNTFGSTKGLAARAGVTLWPADRIDREVQKFAEVMCALPEFSRAVDAAESWILEHTPLAGGNVTQPQRCHDYTGSGFGQGTGGPSTCLADRWRKCVQCRHFAGDDRETGKVIARSEVS